MKRLAVLASIVVAGLTAAGLSAQGGPPPGARPAGPGLPGVTEIEKVTDNVYKIFGGGGNTTVFVRSDGVVLVDTKVPGNGQAILDEVRKVTDKPVTVIINTHSHPDHLGSNDQIDTTLGGNVEVVVQTNTAARMAAMPANSKVSRSFDDTLTLGSGADRIDLHYFGAAHTDGDAFVVFPAEKVLLMGDVMAWDMGPLIDPMSGGSMVATPVTVGRLVQSVSGIDKVIEGHGHVNTWDGLLRYLAYSQKVVEVARRANADATTTTTASCPSSTPTLNENSDHPSAS